MGENAGRGAEEKATPWAIWKVSSEAGSAAWNRYKADRGAREPQTEETPVGRRAWEKSEPHLDQEVQADSMRMRKENAIGKRQPKSKEKRERTGKGRTKRNASVLFRSC